LGELVAARATVKALALGDALRPRWEDRHAAAIELSRDRGQATDGRQLNAATLWELTERPSAHVQKLPASRD
jgi:hypothetical protein